MPGPLVLTPEDVVGAERLLATAAPLVCALVGLNANTASKVRNLLRADYEYLRPLLLDPAAVKRNLIAAASSDRPVMTTQQLAGEAHVSRTALYRTLESLTPSVEECAVALVMLLAARGDFCASTAWRICELESPIGRDATGPGIVGSRQRLFGLSIAGGDVDIPAILGAPSANMGAADLVQRLGEMLTVVQNVAKKAKLYADQGDPSVLASFELPRQMLAGSDTTATLLAPELHVGSLSDAGWELPLRIGNAQTAKLALRHGFANVLAESEDHPYEGVNGWHQIKPEAMRNLLSLGGVVGLDIATRPSLVTYWMRVDDDDDDVPTGSLHRRQHAADAEGEQSGSAVAGEMSYTVAGLHLDKSQDLAKAIAYTEFLARSRGERCVERFGAQLTPSLVKARKPEVRALHRALRIMFNAALISVGRRRQAARLH